VRELKCALVVEDDRALASVLACFMSERAEVVHVATSKGLAEQHLKRHRVDAALIDLALPDGSGVDLLNLLWKRSPLPQVLVISGSATPDTAFYLAQAGVRGFLSKPLDFEGLARAWEECVNRPPILGPLLRSSVGRVSLHAMEQAVRRSMTDEALALTASSRRRASSLLGISRQLLQHILRAQQAPRN
jgi:DNA-binding response OmpR family regulator